MIGLLNAIGKWIAVIPRPLLRLICILLGPVIGWGHPARKQQALANLHFAFPQKSYAQLKRIYRENARRLIEMGLLVVALPHFSKKELRSIIAVDAKAERTLREHFATDPQRQAAVLMIPHLTLSELLTAIPALVDFSLTPTKVIFRPIPSPQLDRWVHDSRSKHGVELLSRKQGFSEALRALARRETVGILFDQKAGGSGSLITFFGRVCLATELPGMLAEKYQAKVFACALQRSGFWRARLCLELLDCQAQATDVTLAAHEWLERYLSATEDQAADWLWLHDRWGAFYKAPQRFSLRHKRDLLRSQNQRLQRSEIPRKTPVLCLLADDPAATKAFAPLLDAIRAERPDFAITLAGADASLFNLLQQQRVEAVLVLPRYTFLRWFVLWRQRKAWPQSVLVFDPSRQAAIGAWLTRCKQRFGMRRGRKKPFGISVDVGRLTPELATKPAQLAKAWLAALQHFGLASDYSLSKTRRTRKIIN